MLQQHSRDLPLNYSNIKQDTSNQEGVFNFNCL